MRNKKILIPVIFCTLVLAVAGFAFGRRQQPPAQTRQQQVPEVPAHVTYRHLFHHSLALKKKAEEFERDGKDSKQFRTHFVRQANLNEAQARLLELLALEYAQQEQLLSLRAKPLIAAYRAQYPGGTVPHGQKLAPPPEELRSLSEQRDELTLRMRDKLRVAPGENEFNKFDGFVKTRVAANIDLVSPQ